MATLDDIRIASELFKTIKNLLESWWTRMNDRKIHEASLIRTLDPLQCTLIDQLLVEGNLSIGERSLLEAIQKMRMSKSRTMEYALQVIAVKQDGEAVSFAYYYEISEEDEPDPELLLSYISDLSRFEITSLRGFVTRKSGISFPQQDDKIILELFEDFLNQLYLLLTRTQTKVQIRKIDQGSLFVRHDDDDESLIELSAHYTSPVVHKISERFETAIKNAVKAKTFPQMVSDLAEMDANKGFSNILFIGGTNTGKSSIINLLFALQHLQENTPFELSLLNRPLGTSPNSSYTCTIQKANLHSSKISLWDTPGYFDVLNRSDAFKAKLYDLIDNLGNFSAVILCVTSLSRILPQEIQILTDLKEKYTFEDDRIIVVGRNKSDDNEIVAARFNFETSSIFLQDSSILCCDMSQINANDHVRNLLNIISRISHTDPHYVQGIGPILHDFRKLKRCMEQDESRKAVEEDLIKKGFSLLEDKVKYYLKNSFTNDIISSGHIIILRFRRRKNECVHLNLKFPIHLNNTIFHKIDDILRFSSERRLVFDPNLKYVSEPNFFQSEREEIYEFVTVQHRLMEQFQDRLRPVLQ